MATIKDVAKAAGVAPSTVSFVLNNKTDIVREETRQRVLRAMRDTGYKPNRLARSFSGGQTKTIGLMISNASNPFFTYVMRTVERMVFDAGYKILIDTTPYFPLSTEGQGHLYDWPVDGVLLWDRMLESLPDTIGSGKRKVPIVYVGGFGPEDAWPVDVYAGASELARHILDRGYRRVAYVAPTAEPDWLSREERYRAYRDVMEVAGLQLVVMAVGGPGDTREGGWYFGQEIVRMDVASRPDCLICHSDDVAIGVYHGVLRGGLRVPEDIAVTGFDGIPESRFLDRPLTTIALPIPEMCRSILNVLFARIDDAPIPPAPANTLKMTLVVGETT